MKRNYQNYSSFAETEEKEPVVEVEETPVEESSIADPEIPEAVIEVAKEVVEKKSEPVKKEKKTTEKKVTVNSEVGLYVRSQADRSSSILKTLANRDILTVVEDSDKEWLKIKTADGVVGYVMKAFVVNS